MSERLQQTQAMLARHHRDGERFAELMKKSFAERFNEQFWAEWAQWIEPVYSATPVVLDLGAGPGLFVKALAEVHGVVDTVKVQRVAGTFHRRGDHALGPVIGGRFVGGGIGPQIIGMAARD